MFHYGQYIDYLGRGALVVQLTFSTFGGMTAETEQYLAKLVSNKKKHAGPTLANALGEALHDGRAIGPIDEMEAPKEQNFIGAS